MIRLLLVDQQQWVRQKLIDWLATEADIEIVALADNERAAIEKVEQLHPDLVLFDLSMPAIDGVKTIETIARQDRKTKILVFYDRDRNYHLIRALIAGVKGCLYKDSSKEDWLAALHAVYRGSVYFGAEVWQRNFQSLRSLPQFESRLERWTIWLAREVIVWWRTHSEKEPLSTTELLAQLELTDNPKTNQIFKLLEQPSGEISLREQLRSQIEKLKASYQKQASESPSQQLQEAMRKISQSFAFARKNEFCYLSVLNARVRTLRGEKIERFQKCFTALLQTSAPQPLLHYWEDLESSLIDLHQQYQSKYEQHLNRNNSAWRAYLHLKAKLYGERQSYETYTSKDWQAAWNAVYYIYEDTLSAEISRLASLLIAELLQQTRFYLENLKQTEAFLEELQMCFEEQNNANSLPIPILVAHFSEKIDPVQLRDRLEASLGHSLNYWVTSAKISTQDIRELLLVELRPLALAIYMESYREAISLSGFENSFEDY
jgi:DNA-binding NarL/FixJ family response regulator